jgi:diguanylate cyclase (GGDEF)-like protein
MGGTSATTHESEQLFPSGAGLNSSPSSHSQISSDQQPYLPIAESIIHEIISRLRHSSDLSEILQLAIESMVESLGADRGLIWQVSGDRMMVSNEHAVRVPECFIGSKLAPQESAALMLEFLSCFPEDSANGVLGISDISTDKRLSKVSPTLNALMELGSVNARLIAQLRCRGLLSGFVELQQCSNIRQWSKDDISAMQSVSEILSVVVRQSFDQKRIEDDAQKMKLINEIANLFRESGGVKTRDTLGVSVAMAAARMGFCESQIYLCPTEKAELVPQLAARKDPILSLEDKSNPFVEAYSESKDKVINAEYTTKADTHFGHDTAMIVPLNCEDERIGVLGLWKLTADHPGIRPQDRELALTVATQLANVIHAENAIAQLRADRSREALINKVSNEIKQSLKDVDQICQTLVSTLSNYLKLSFCSVSLWDSTERSYKAPKVAYNCPVIMQATIYTLAEKVLQHTRGPAQDGRAVYLNSAELTSLMASHIQGEQVPGKSATVIPLINDMQLRAVLLMVSDQGDLLLEKDLQMVQNLADQLAVVLAHAELFVQVEQQAITDPMTGLYNRRYFSEHLSKEIDRNQRFGHSFSCILCDLDHLKHINDTFGHQYGDAAIKHVAKMLQTTARDVDIVARYGGEEFLILLPETGQQAARAAAERFCKAIRESMVEGLGQITASIGVATFPEDANDKEQLLKSTDRALYAAKRQGRNQVQSFGSI